MITGLNAFLFNELMNDDAIKAVFAPKTPRIYYTWGIMDTDFPYIVHRLDMRPDPRVWGVMQGIWVLELWDHAPSASNVHAMRNRIVGMYQRRLLPDGADWKSARLWLEEDPVQPTQADAVWHEAVIFGIRATATGDIDRVLTREGM